MKKYTCIYTIQSDYGRKRMAVYKLSVLGSHDASLLTDGWYLLVVNVFKLMKGTLNFPNVKCQHFFTSSSENPGTNIHECGVLILIIHESGVIILINCAGLFKLFLFIYNVNRIYIPFPVKEKTQKFVLLPLLYLKA